MKTDTPRTDEVEAPYFEGAVGKLCRQLERENADLRAQLAARDAKIEHMRPVVEELLSYIDSAGMYQTLLAVVRDYESKVTK